MTSSLQGSQQSAQLLAAEFFQQSEGEWRSQRRYYTLTSEEVQEVVSLLQVRFLPAQSEELRALAKLHQLEEKAFLCGAKTSWESNYTGTKRKPAKGSTIFGVRENLLYRDRGFATAKPITAQFYFTNPQTMCLRTEYNGSLFEEELKLIGQKYRTRQTIISRAGEEQTIGQYLEKRMV